MKNNIFIGNKSKPSYLLEFNKSFNKVSIYQPDKYSMKDKDLDFFEKYVLGKCILEIPCDEFIINNKELITFKKEYLHIPEIIIKYKKNYIIINSSIIQLKSYKKL